MSEHNVVVAYEGSLTSEAIGDTAKELRVLEQVLCVGEVGSVVLIV